MTSGPSRSGRLCECCQSIQQAFYCAACLREGISNYETPVTALSHQCKEAGERAGKLLKDVTAWRELRAEVANRQQRVKRLKERLQEPVPSAKAAITRLRPPTLTVSSINEEIRAVRQRQRDVSRGLVRARKVLVAEAVKIFGIRQRKAWEIAGIPLPPSEEFRVNPHSHVTGALTHIIHLARLLTRYLALDLPFVPEGDRIVPNLPFVSTTSHRGTNDWHMPPIWDPQKHSSFLTTYALLCHSIAYLAFCVGVEGIGVDSDEVKIPATSPLELLRAMAALPVVRSHAPGVETLRHLGFGLDVNRVIQTIHHAEDTKWEEGWQMVDEDESQGSLAL